jgi:hypothetical protein
MFPPAFTPDPEVIEHFIRIREHIDPGSPFRGVSGGADTPGTGNSEMPPLVFVDSRDGHGVGDGQRLTGVRAENEGCVPCAQKHVCLSKRQFVGSENRQSVAAVVVRLGVIVPRIEGIGQLPPCAVLHRAARIQHVRPGPVQVEAQALRKPLPQAKEERLVVRPAGACAEPQGG